MDRLGTVVISEVEHQKCHGNVPVALYIMTRPDNERNLFLPLLKFGIQCADRLEPIFIRTQSGPRRVQLAIYFALYQS